MKRLLEKTSGKCHLCGHPIIKVQPVGCRKSAWRLLQPSRDHLVPIMRGGKNGIKNLMPAHALCNAQRGDKPIEYTRMELMFLNAYPIAQEWEVRGLPIKFLYPGHEFLTRTISARYSDPGRHARAKTYKCIKGKS
jgi:5-methylcytosine-specific restriction endonuclease McrA